MKRSYTLTIDILPDGQIQAKETYAGITIQEIVGLLEIQKHNILAKLQTTAISMPDVQSGEQPS